MESSTDIATADTWRRFTPPPRSFAPLSRWPKQRFCPEVITWQTNGYRSQLLDDRDAGFWTPRRLIDHAPDVTAATWINTGFDDRVGSGHAFQGDWAWRALSHAPKRLIAGPWAHIWPTTRTLPGNIHSFNNQVLAWFDYWLKGRGTPPRLGIADYQDDTGIWHASSSWPPAHAHNEVLYLSKGSLSPEAPRFGSETFRDVLNEQTWGACADPAPTPTQQVYVSKPVQHATTFAGDPLAYLGLSSDQPGGLITVDLYREPAHTACGSAQLLTSGSADLRFYNNENYIGTAFPTDRLVHVRINIANHARVFNVGDRLIAVLSYASDERTTQPRYTPNITIHGDGTPASQIVIPVITGTFGGTDSTLHYPRRPFAPR